MAMPSQTNEMLLAQRCLGWGGRRGEAVSQSLAADSMVVTSSLPEAPSRPRDPLQLGGNTLLCFSSRSGASLMSKHVPLIPPAALQSLLNAVGLKPA